MLHEVYLGLGSNVGDREENIKSAVKLIAERVGAVLALSSFYETEPWGYMSKKMYVNAAVKVKTTLSPEDLLDETQAIERKLGRVYKTVNREYRDRTIDIDILLYDDLKLKTPRLTIPHPLMYEREFVMKPLMEIGN